MKIYTILELGKMYNLSEDQINEFRKTSTLLWIFGGFLGLIIPLGLHTIFWS